MTYSVYGYNIYQDDEDITTAFFSQLLGQDGIECLSVDGEGNLVPKRGEAVGTGFFVSKDGKVVTNLHITQPWLSNPSSSDDPVGKKINQQVQDILIQTGNGALCSRITVKPQLYGIGIIPMVWCSVPTTSCLARSIRSRAACRKTWPSFKQKAVRSQRR